VMQSGLDFLGGERTYTMLEAAVRRHQRLSYSDFLDLKFKAAGAVDPLPVQRTYSLGSVGGVRGKDFDSWGVPRGDRLLLANIEYRRRLPTVRYIQSVFSTWWLVAFYDAGALFISKDPDDLGTLISDASDHAGSGTGVGVSGSSFLPYIGMFVAKDLDTDSWRFIVRLNRPF
jgi:hemolysin activation/secretion protein